MPSTRRYYMTQDGRPPQGGRPPAAPPIHGRRNYIDYPRMPQSLIQSFAPPPPPYTQTPPLAPPLFVAPLITWVQNPYSLPVIPAPPTAALPCCPGPPQYTACPDDGPSCSKLSGARPRFSNGELYIFPEKHTTFHIAHSIDFKPWERPGARFAWRAFLCPQSFTIKELIRRLIQNVGPDESKVGIVEMIELGSGTWLKGSEFHLDEDKSKQTLAEIGWDEHRGSTKRPTWLYVMSA